MQHATEDAALRRLWWQWTEVVELFAHRSRRRMHLAPADYAKLHSQLLAACRSRAVAVSGPRREFYYRLLYLAQPWVSQEALETGEREIVLDLCLQCRQAERELGLRLWRLDVRLWAGVAVTLAAAAGAIWLVIRTQHQSVHHLLERAKGSMITARWYIKNTSESTVLSIATVIVILLGVYLVYRSTRSSST